MHAVPGFLPGGPAPLSAVRPRTGSPLCAPVSSGNGAAGLLPRGAPVGLVGHGAVATGPACGHLCVDVGPCEGLSPRGCCAFEQRHRQRGVGSPRDKQPPCCGRVSVSTVPTNPPASRTPPLQGLKSRAVPRPQRAGWGQPRWQDPWGQEHPPTPRDDHPPELWLPLGAAASVLVATQKPQVLRFGNNIAANTRNKRSRVVIQSKHLCPASRRDHVSAANRPSSSERPKSTPKLPQQELLLFEPFQEKWANVAIFSKPPHEVVVWGHFSHFAGSQISDEHAAVTPFAVNWLFRVPRFIVAPSLRVGGVLARKQKEPVIPLFVCGRASCALRRLRHSSELLLVQSGV